MDSPCSSKNSDIFFQFQHFSFQRVKSIHSIQGKVPHSNRFGSHLIFQRKNNSFGGQTPGSSEYYATQPLDQSPNQSVYIC